MATQLPSLFGGTAVTPEQLAEARAMQFSQMTPQQQMQYNIFRNVNRLGRGVAGLFGADVTDPVARKSSEVRRLADQFDTTTAEGMMQYARALRSIDPNLSVQAAEKAQQMRETEASIAQKTAAAGRERQQAIPADILKSQTIAGVKQAIRTLEGQEKTPEVVSALQTYKDQLEALEPKEKEPKINYGAEADRASVANFGKPFGQLTQQQAKVIDDLLETRGVTKAKAGAGKTEVTIPGVKTPGDVVSLRKDIQATTKPYQDQIDAANSAIGLADLALKNNNFAAVSSLQRSLAKAAGETQLSARDVDAFGIDPSLVGRVADTLSRLATGTPTADTLTKLRQLAFALKKKAESDLALEEQQTLDVARASGQFTEEQLNTVFRRRPAPKGGKTNTRTTRSGVTYTVEND